jgi:hypothetical protein
MRMDKGITTNPDAALSGLIAVAWVGVLFVGGGLAVDGVLNGAWVRVLGGAAYLLGFSWMIWEAGQVVRKAVKASKKP